MFVKAAAGLMTGTYGLFVAKNAYSMFKVEEGSVSQVAAGGRLHAFKVTGNGAPNTWAKPIHGVVGAIYLTMGEVGAEKIGEAFASDEMQRELSKSTTDIEASLTIAKIEHATWTKFKTENPLSLGGNLGASFSPATRHTIQQCIAQLTAFDKTNPP